VGLLVAVIQAQVDKVQAGLLQPFKVRPVKQQPVGLQQHNEAERPAQRHYLAEVLPEGGLPAEKVDELAVKGLQVQEDPAYILE